MLTESLDRTPSPKTPVSAPVVPACLVNRQAALLLSIVFLIVGGTGVSISYAVLHPTRRLSYLRQSALEFIEREDWRGASLQLSNIVQMSPRDSWAWYQLGLVQLRGAAQGDAEALQRATQHLRRAVEIDPDHWQAHRWLLDLELRAGDWHDAHHNAYCLSALCPQHPLLSLAFDVLPAGKPEVIHEAWSKLNAGHAQAALDLVDGGKLGSPFWNADAVRIAIYSLTQLGRHQDRDQLFHRLAVEVPESNRLKCLRAEAALLDDDPDGATQWAAQAQGSTCALMAQQLLAEASVRRSQTKSRSVPTPKEQP